MSETYHTRGQWEAAFKSAAQDLLARGAGGADSGGGRVYTLPCPRHGRGCVCVVCGGVLRHCPWGRLHPRWVAERLVCPWPGPRPPAPDAGNLVACDRPL
jgi:hypothetical protein